MNGKNVFYALGLISLLLCGLIVPGQKHLLNSKEIDDKFSKVWKTSEATRKLYSWKSKTEATRDEKIMQVLTEEISYGPDGRQVQKVLSNHEAPLPSGFIVHQVAEDQKAKIVEFMKELSGFLEKYALDSDSARHAFFSNATISLPDANGILMVSGANVLTKGDRLNWWIDTRTYSITKATISTTYKGTSAEFSANYNLLPGLNYMSSAIIRVPSKNMIVKLQFYDYNKR
jgi:hypothetical protein